MTIGEIKKLLAKDAVSSEDLNILKNDTRVGVQKLLLSYNNRQQKLAKKKAAFLKRFAYEKTFWAKSQIVAGVDEVGRGPLAGPVVTAAVVIDNSFDLIDVNDSKKISASRRLELYPLILEKAVDVAIGVKGPEIIDKVNLYEADRLAMAAAVRDLYVKPDALLVDAMQVPLNLPQIRLIKGDSKSNSIAAASIVAKVFRDKLMADYARIYPEYHFDENAGYGTQTHIQALKKYGPCTIHRKTFAPVNSFYH